MNMGERVREFWDIVGVVLASVIILFMLFGLILQLRKTPPYMSKGGQIVMDCVVILGCMWAVWYLGRWW